MSRDGENEGVFVNKYGKVGIGTTGPDAKLDIYSTGSGSENMLRLKKTY